MEKLKHRGMQQRVRNQELKGKVNPRKGVHKPVEDFRLKTHTNFSELTPGLENQIQPPKSTTCNSGEPVC